MAGVTRAAVKSFWDAWLYSTHTDDVLEIPGNTFHFGNHSFLSLQKKILGIFSLKRVLNFQVSFCFQAIKLPSSHLHWWLFWSSSFSSAWYHNAISFNELSSKHLIVVPLPTYFRETKGLKMLWLLTQNPAFTYIFTLSLFTVNSLHTLQCQEHIISFSLISVSQVPITACVVKSAFVYTCGQA